MLRPVPRYLVDRVLTEIVPPLQAKGLQWWDDYAGGDPQEIGANTIPLQQRTAEVWPTVELAFSNRGHPAFMLDFAALPPICRRYGLDPVPREQATVTCAPGYFTLCKGSRRNFDCQFGYRWISVAPYRRIDREINLAIALLPQLLDILDSGIPNEWLTRPFGYVTEHVLLAGSWHLSAKRRRRP